MIDWFGSFGAGLIRIAALMAILSISTLVSIKVVDRVANDASDNRKLAIGCPVIIVVMVLLMILFGPALHALQEFECRHAEDFDFCMNPPDYDPM